MPKDWFRIIGMNELIHMHKAVSLKGIKVTWVGKPKATSTTVAVVHFGEKEVILGGGYIGCQDKLYPQG